VSVSTKVVVGLDSRALRNIVDCLELAVIRGDTPDLHTLTGASFPEIRSMYLTASGALGRFMHAHRIASDSN
jgi:hypothetical protein